MIFPTVHGTSLSGRKYVVPFGLEGEYNVVLIAFEPSHQFQLQTWLAPLERLKETYARFRYYQLPVLWSYAEDQRAMIDESMRRAIPGTSMQEIIITLYADKQVFCDLLDLQGEAHIYVLLIDHEGEVLWRTERGATREKIDSLTSMLDELCRTDSTTA